MNAIILWYGPSMHEHYLLAALEQARLGRGTCSPNPSVGAVAVLNNQIIGRAWHRGAGTSHAERLLFEQLIPNTPDITLYVTLEPCNHWGKTPPCVDAIIQQGICRVVYAYADPNPLVADNHTPMLLQQHGIDVVHYPLPEIDAFYQSYTHWIKHRRPFVTAKIAQTLDGKLAGPNGERLYLSNDLCSEFTHQQRQLTDVILTTARTINQDDPKLNARLDGKVFAKPVVILDRCCSLREDANILTTARHCHIYHDAKYKPKLNHPNCSYYPIESIDNTINLKAVLTHLGELGYHDVWVEAGNTLFQALHQLRLVNKTHVYIVPKWLDNTITPTHSAWHIKGDNVVLSLDWAGEETEA